MRSRKTKINWASRSEIVYIRREFPLVMFGGRLISKMCAIKVLQKCFSHLFLLYFLHTIVCLHSFSFLVYHKYMHLWTLYSPLIVPFNFWVKTFPAIVGFFCRVHLLIYIEHSLLFVLLYSNSISFTNSTLWTLSHYTLPISFFLRIYLFLSIIHRP